MSPDAERAGTAGRRSTAPPRRPITLESRLVRYEDGPDRLTVCPPGLAGEARMSTWLSADRDAFLDLETVR
ncbi:hypothetical protein BRC85_03795 [Halobacteriales archaeon QS_1_69_70]|nr:MAG: hypothetical protein BRC85_03795 [Halobacteriales archaeon QS_1_69_70]